MIANGHILVQIGTQCKGREVTKDAIIFHLRINNSVEKTIVDTNIRTQSYERLQTIVLTNNHIVHMNDKSVADTDHRVVNTIKFSVWYSRYVMRLQQC